MTRVLFAAATLLAVAGVAAAQCGTPAVATYHAPYAAHKEVVVKKEVVVPVIAPVAVYAVVPAYAAVYVPPVAAPAPAAAPAQPSGEMSQVLDLLKGMDARLKALEGRDQPQPAAGAKPDPFAPKPQASTAGGLAVLRSRCASCHEAGIAASKGGSVTLFQGDALAALSPKTKLDVLTSIYDGTMPKRGGGREPLSDAETSSVVEFVKSLK